MRTYWPCLALALPLALLVGRGIITANDTETAPGPGAQGDRAGRSWTTAVEPKPLTANVKRGLAWLAEHQNRDGGWGQGEESEAMRGSGRDELRDTSNVADTCIAALALIRSGSTPIEGPYRDALAKAVRFVRNQVEASDSQSMSVTGVQGTRVQQKLGPNIDTFLALLLLAEVKGKMPEDEEKPVELALDKVLGKIRKNQKEDGSFEGGGWAPVLAQAMCGKGINRARQAGADVPDDLLARTETYAKNQVLALADPPPAAVSGEVSTSPPTTAPTGPIAATRAPTRGDVSGFKADGSAGVPLYAGAASLGALQDSVNTNQSRRKELERDLRTSKDEKVLDEARRLLSRFDEADKAHEEAQSAVLKRLDDPGFIAGFGSNGGEEFLSYMNISESLVVKGGDEWKQWDAGMTDNLDRVQNEDGSWSGHHCITGRTFCTSAALLVLMADRTPVPVEARN